MNGPLEFYRRKLLGWTANIVTPPETEIDPSKYELKNRLLRSSGMSIGKNVVIMPRFQTLASVRQYIFLEDYVLIGSDVKVWSFNNIRVGRFSVIGSGVTLVSGGHDADTLEPTSAPIAIGNGCWIGLGARILAGVTIGDHAFIQPGALINRDVPARAIVEGVPGRVVGQRDLPEVIHWWGGIKYSAADFLLNP